MSDMVNKSQLSSVIHLFDVDSTVEERFLGFTNADVNHTARALFELVSSN